MLAVFCALLVGANVLLTFVVPINRFSRLKETVVEYIHSPNGKNMAVVMAHDIFDFYYSVYPVRAKFFYKSKEVADLTADPELYTLNWIDDNTLDIIYAITSSGEEIKKTLRW